MFLENMMKPRHWERSHKISINIMVCLWFFTADDMVLTCSFSLFDTLIFDVLIGVKTVGLFFKLKIALTGCEDGARNSWGSRNTDICLSDTCSTPADVPEGITPAHFYIVFIFLCLRAFVLSCQYSSHADYERVTVHSFKTHSINLR